MRLFRNLGRKTLTSPGKVQIMALVTTCYQALILTDKNETFSQSWPEDADISGKVQMTTLVTACYQALSLTDSK